MVSGNVKVDVSCQPETRGWIRSMYLVIGLLACDYPKGMIGRFVNECVELKQDGLLDANMAAGMHFLESAMGQETLGKLLRHMTERVEIHDPEVELVYDPAIADEYRAEQEAKARKEVTVETVDRVPDPEGLGQTGGFADPDRTATGESAPAGPAKKAPAKKPAGAKTAARAAAAGRKTAARTGKKATGAADGK